MQYKGKNMQEINITSEEIEKLAVFFTPKALNALAGIGLTTAGKIRRRGKGEDLPGVKSRHYRKILNFIKKEFTNAVNAEKIIFKS